jgi:UDP-N-acetylglucosamine 2-epimerase
MRLDPRKILIVIGTRPEELNRGLTGVMASIHFAPTARARQNLLRECVSAERIHVTGNIARATKDRAFAAIEPEQLKGKSVVNTCGWRQ